MVTITKTPAPDDGPVSEKTFFGHPRGLATLFLTEMWERFSFYGMRALLPLYLIAGGPAAAAGSQGNGLAMSESTTLAITSLYMALVYLPCMVGGWLGDRLWGPRRTVIVAGCVIVAGHLLLAVPGLPPFFAGLALVAIGSGLLKANISTMVGHLYQGPDDPRRDGGFTIFYMGINLGGLLAPLIIGTIGQQVSWHLGFALAAAGMALGLVQFVVGTRHLGGGRDVVPEPVGRAELRTVLRTSGLWLAAAAVVSTALVLSGHFTMDMALAALALAGIAIPVVVLVRIKRDKDLDAGEQSRMSAYVWFFVAAAVFWMIYDQGASTMAVFGAKNTSGELFGFGFPSSWLQSANPVFIMALGPVFAWVWLWLARRRQEPTTTVKFAMGLWLIGVSFLVFVVPMAMSGGGAEVSPMWLVSIYLIQTIGELCLSPVGLSVTTKMAPLKYASQTMGIWFLAVTAGDSVASLLVLSGVKLGTTPVVGVEGALAVLAGLVLFLQRKRVESLGAGPAGPGRSSAPGSGGMATGVS
ncbi:peptide MFS transporter [Streptomyces sp. WAC06614]|uniref:peptide MFS transporter n=1 Tax=Streptomyces sp. WAC06614 TaxID=2487416 RepID=UPI000F7A29F8|nr:oligopeptide:H+ symporter [Streptomyces sp. WAC06614]RSS83589.1 MFS transporter [Streptomyces sp. WAC06614]